MLDGGQKVVLLVVVVSVLAGAQQALSRVPLFSNPDTPSAFAALLAGAVVALVGYLPIKATTRATTAQAGNLAVLLGVVTAYLMLLEIRPGLPSAGTLAFGVFLFYYQAERALGELGATDAAQ